MIIVDAIRSFIIQSLQQLENYIGTTDTDENIDYFMEVWIPNRHPVTSAKVNSSITTTPKKLPPIKYCYIGLSHHSLASNLVHLLQGRKASLVFSIPYWLLDENGNNKHEPENSAFKKHQRPYMAQAL
jgi:hypothetical protein